MDSATPQNQQFQRIAHRPHRIHDHTTHDMYTPRLEFLTRLGWALWSSYIHFHCRGAGLQLFHSTGFSVYNTSPFGTISSGIDHLWSPVSLHSDCIVRLCTRRGFGVILAVIVATSVVVAGCHVVILGGDVHCALRGNRPGCWGDIEPVSVSIFLRTTPFCSRLALRDQRQRRLPATAH